MYMEALDFRAGMILDLEGRAHDVLLDMIKMMRMMICFGLSKGLLRNRFVVFEWFSIALSFCLFFLFVVCISQLLLSLMSFEPCKIGL